MKRFRKPFSNFACAVLLAAASALAGAGGQLLGACGPFTDVAADSFCAFVLEIFSLGITTGTTPTTYDPTSNVSRLQMAAFLSRTVDGVLRRGSRRAALDQFWTPKNSGVLALTTVGSVPYLLASDGADVWVANNVSGDVSRVRSSDGKLLETWTGAPGAYGVVAAMGKVFVSGTQSGGRLYRIDPSQAAGAVTTVASGFAASPQQIAFDGSRIWAAASGAVTIITPGPSIPWTTTTITTGFSAPRGMIFDGSNVWTVDAGADTLLKLDASGAILQTVTVGDQPVFPAFDGTNFWVPATLSASVSVVRASSGAVLSTLTATGLGFALSAAFDGQRVLVTGTAVDTVVLFKAADLSLLGSVPTGSNTAPWGACSDGVSFWIALSNINKIARF